MADAPCPTLRTGIPSLVHLSSKIRLPLTNCPGYGTQNSRICHRQPFCPQIRDSSQGALDILTVCQTQNGQDAISSRISQKEKRFHTTGVPFPRYTHTNGGKGLSPVRSTWPYNIPAPPSPRGISITSKSLKACPSTVKRTSVRTACHPMRPAAPGLMCSKPSAGSGCTLRI